jgi:hypothetical protein
MDDTECYDRGMARRRQVLGAAWVDRAGAGKDRLHSGSKFIATPLMQ